MLTGIVIGHCVWLDSRLSVCVSVCLSVHPKWHSCFNFLIISAIDLKFGGMMHSTMEQIAIKNGHVRPIFAHFTELPPHTPPTHSTPTPHPHPHTHTHTPKVVGGYIGFTPSVHPSVCPASRVHSVASTVVVWSISYLHILSSNFRRCVACKVSCKISTF